MENIDFFSLNSEMRHLYESLNKLNSTLVLSLSSLVSYSPMVFWIEVCLKNKKEVIWENRNKNSLKMVFLSLWKYSNTSDFIKGMSAFQGQYVLDEIIWNVDVEALEFTKEITCSKYNFINNEFSE